jgi:hypothetical protein
MRQVLIQEMAVPKRAKNLPFFISRSADIYIDRSAQKINTNVYGCRGKRAVELWLSGSWWRPEEITKKTSGCFDYGLRCLFQSTSTATPRNISCTHFCKRLSRPQGHSAAGRIKSMKNSSATSGNRTRDLPTCSAVPQPTAPLRVP